MAGDHMKIDDLTPEETQLIHMLRNESQFSLAVRVEGNDWRVALEDPDLGEIVDGRGRDFAQAWGNIARNIANRRIQPG
jgi:hypothetical protein